MVVVLVAADVADVVVVGWVLVEAAAGAIHAAELTHAALKLHATYQHQRESAWKSLAPP